MESFAMEMAEVATALATSGDEMTRSFNGLARVLDDLQQDDDRLVIPQGASQAEAMRAVLEHRRRRASNASCPRHGPITGGLCRRCAR